ncbi:unnamed protein product [Caenorhabditis angaria]|uniref:Uncharacterized protein n=1 Tax=Caenorhabditis angaria TaxID=860376 RepID=A0A9P1MWR1_9PELO|nr:unnamed protein product [Caenorhabditis angaria]
MSIEQLEIAYSNNVIEILQTIGNNAVEYTNILGDRAMDIVISNIEEYLAILKNIRNESTDNTQTANPVTLSPQHFNDSMLIHRTRLSRSSKSRLNVMRTSPENCRQTLQFSPMEIDRNATIIDVTPISIETHEQSTLIDPTISMDESTNERGFLADVSSLNGTVRSRQPSFNFDSISPVQQGFEFEHEAPIFTEMLRNHAGKDQSVILIEQTPKPRSKLVDETPKNLWNVKLRPGSNRKISEEIRREIQRQLDE